MTAPTPNNMPVTISGPVGNSVPPAAAAPPSAGAAPADPQPAPTAPDSAAEAPTPPWGSDDEFDPARAWALITNLRNENADIRAKTDPIVAAHEQQRRDAMADTDRLREDLTTASAATDLWRNQAIQAKAEALAAGKFVSTEVALKLIGDLSEFATDDGIDTDRLTARLDALATEHPFLVPQQQNPPPQGLLPNRAQGQSGTGPLSLDAQIQAAEARGDVLTSIALKQQKLYQHQH